MKKILMILGRYVRSSVSYILAFLVFLFIVPLLMVLLLLPPKKRYESKVLFFLLDLLYRGMRFAILMPIKIYGAENLPEKPAIIISNHQSSLDIPFIGSLLKRKPHMWFALADFKNTPLLGFFISRVGVWVDRTTSASGARSLLAGIKNAQMYRSHMILFPEGGRSSRGALHKFLAGFVILARKSGRKVIPVYMPYNWKLLPPDGYLLGNSPIIIVVGPAFELYQDESDERFLFRITQWYDQQIKEYG